MMAISIQYRSAKGINGKIIEKTIAPTAICEPFVSKKLAIAFPNDEASPLLCSFLKM